VPPFSPARNYVPAVDTLHLHLTPAAPDPAEIFPVAVAWEPLGVRRASALPRYQVGRFTLTQIPAPHTHYALAYQVTRAGFAPPLGVLYLDQKPTLPTARGLLPFQFSNAALYADWSPVFTDFLRVAGLQFHNYTQLHIALDTTTDLVTGVRSLHARADVAKGRGVTKMLEITAHEAGHASTPGLYFGASTSDRRTVFYQKTDEATRAGKSYILAHHAANGLGPGPVWRSELRMRHGAFSKRTTGYVTESGEYVSAHRYPALPTEISPEYARFSTVEAHDVELARLGCPAYLVTLFQKFTNLDFRLLDNAHVSRCTPLPVFDFAKYQKEIIAVKEPRHFPTAEPNAAAKRREIEAPLRSYKATRNPAFLRAALELAEAYGMRAEHATLLARYNVEAESELAAL